MPYDITKMAEPWDKLLSLAEAAEIWKIDESTIRKSIQNGRLIDGQDCRKFGKQWVIRVDAMARTFNRSAGPYDYMPWLEYLHRPKRTGTEKTTTANSAMVKK